jgi:hypothetical protein
MIYKIYTVGVSPAVPRLKKRIMDGELQKKNLHFAGAQVFHNRCQGPNVTDPVKKARYADQI